MGLGLTGNARPTTSTTVDQLLGHTGVYFDTSGLDKMGVRSYDRTINRFTQVAPSGQERNAYLYAGGLARLRQVPAVAGAPVMARSS
ncbi:RHS repeat-associated core domain-containing protein [Streptomyces sp. NPDC005132]|uniref:RHS repeat-associated core domain-containing protein n=1 Tax=Streptomyces sp. NPDC005132 TaxID=3154294 RepID=UPI0033A3FD95